MHPSLTAYGREIRIEGRFLRIARLEGDGYEFIDDAEGLLAALRRAGRKIDLFTFMQRLPETSPKYCFPMEWDNFAALPLSTFETWWTRQIDSKTRNMVRKAEKKGVIVRESPFDDVLVRGISNIYNECPIRQGRRFPHYGKDLGRVYEEEATFPGRSLFLGAYYCGELIGFAKLVSDETGTQAGLMNILSAIAHRDKAPTNALIAQAVRSCTERGIRYMVYSQFAYGRKVQSGIAEFKASNGFLRIDVPRYFVPLSLAGSAALRMGLHKRWTERLPEPVLAKLRDLRTLWYGRQRQGMKEIA